MAKEIRTEIVIEAPAAAVWAVLTDFPAHADWDPFLAGVEGQAGVGERLKVRFRNGFSMRPSVTAVEAGRVLEWFGKVAFGGLFDGRHRFELIAEGARTRFVHSEQFTGVLVPFLGSMLGQTERGFLALNQALKERVEAKRSEWPASSA